MKMRFVVCISIAMVVVFLHSVGFAETIHLLDGRILKEKIVERNSRYILTVDERKMRHKHYTGQIDFIEEDEQEGASNDINGELVLYEDISKEKVQLINAFIDASGVRRHMKQNLESVVSKARKEQKRDYSALLDIDAIIERLVPIYNKYYSEKDLNELVQFYKSPAGRKTLEVTPKIMKETVGVSLQYIQEKIAP